MWKCRCAKHQTINTNNQTKCHAICVCVSRIWNGEKSRRAPNQFKYKNKPFHYLFYFIVAIERINVSYAINDNDEHTERREHTPFTSHIWCTCINYDLWIRISTFFILIFGFLMTPKEDGSSELQILHCILCIAYHAIFFWIWQKNLIMLIEWFSRAFLYSSIWWRKIHLIGFNRFRINWIVSN